MGKETANHISELDSANPVGATDSRRVGDDHIRMIKAVLLTDFAAISGAVTASHVELNYNDITTLGTGQASKVVTVDAGSAWTMAGLTCADAGILTTVDINGGSIDGVTIGAASAPTVTDIDINGGAIDGAIVGAASAAAGTFTVLKADTSLELATGATVTGILDEDAMSTDSATQLATQQSIKAYVDASAIGVGQSWQATTATDGVSTQNGSSTQSMMVSINWVHAGGSSKTLTVHCDAANPPTTQLVALIVDDNTTYGGSAQYSFIVPPDFYWKFTTSGGGSATPTILDLR